MDDDFNAPQGLAAIFELVNLVNKNSDNPEFLHSGKMMIKELLGIFGISLKKSADHKREEAQEDEIIKKIAQRNKARQDKNYALADQIRKELEDKGIILEDTKDGKTTWRERL